jgi:ElaB/YqjD/DUF883 family membrane-anchored ribosome-binding protein
MNAPAEKLTQDIKVLVTDLQELLKATTSHPGERIAAARVRLENALAQAQDTVTLRARNAAEATDRYVHQNAWTATAISAAVGLVIGFLITRR